jgi:hypothetical protein
LELLGREGGHRVRRRAQGVGSGGGLRGWGQKMIGRGGGDGEGVRPSHLADICFLEGVRPSHLADICFLEGVRPSHLADICFFTLSLYPDRFGSPIEL